MSGTSPSADLLLLTAVLANRHDAGMADRLHALAHDGRLEHLVIAKRDAQRRRLRLTTDKGTECAIALPRDRKLRHGDVLLLEDTRAIVVRIGEEQWLRLMPRDAAVAVRLGYHAGNLHWRVRFDGADLMVSIEGPRQSYLDRLVEFLEAGEIEVGA